MRHLVLIAALLLASHSAHAAALPGGAGRFDFSRAGKHVPVWYYLPANATADTPILIVMHGVGRDAERYRNDWMPHAKKGPFILIAPEFSNAEFPENENYSTGGMQRGQRAARPAVASSFSFIEPIFDEVKASTGNRSERYHLFGHSAGAQFVHRYLYFVPEARVGRAVAANAGWWTMPDRTVDFPYGLGGSALSDAALKTMLGRPLTILLGTADTDPDDANLRRTPEALAQGPNRFARGHSFYEAGRKQAAALRLPLGWKIATAPGVGHTDRGMAEYALPWLLGESSARRTVENPAPR